MLAQGMHKTSCSYYYAVTQSTQGALLSKVPIKLDPRIVQMMLKTTENDVK